MKPSLKNLPAALLAAVTLTALPLSAQTFLDNFTDDAGFLSSTTSLARSINQTGLSGVRGGERRLTETQIAVNGGSVLHTASITDGDGLEFINGNNSKNEVLLEYGLSNGVKFDFSAFAAGGSLRLVDWFSDQPNVQLEMTLRSNVGTGLASSQSKLLTLSPSVLPAPTNVDFAFSLFDQIDFANIDDITLRFTAQSFATDAGVSSLEVQIPEPGTYAFLLGLVSFGLVQLRRRGLV